MIVIQPTGPGNNPTALYMLIGSRLRRLREACGISRDRAARQIRASEPKISRLELGRVSPKDRDVSDLLTLYGVDGRTRDGLLSLVDRANSPGWWHHYRDVLPAWSASYLALESMAALIRTYKIQFVPELLQTQEYARAVMAAGHTAAQRHQIERRVELLMQRQRLLRQDGGLCLWAVLDEAVLHRSVGGAEVMRDQITFLQKMLDKPNVRLQVLPLRAGGHLAQAGSFTILRFRDPGLSDVVFVEQLTSGICIDGRNDVERYTVAMEHLCAHAGLSPRLTAKILQTASPS